LQDLNLNLQTPELQKIYKQGFVPFDFGVHAMMIKEASLKERGLQMPKSIHDFTKPEWKRNFVFEDPRTSTPGLSLVTWTAAKFDKASFTKLWKELSRNWLTLPTGWDQAYGLFLKDEVAAVWSYSTSEAYHLEKGEKRGDYQAVLLEEGSPVQIEGAFRIKNASFTAAEEKCSKLFFDVLLSKEIQERIPKSNWMMPVLAKNVVLPLSFQKLAFPKLPFYHSKTSMTDAISQWSRAIK
jgi:thiamine transport system substrate-binding protein